MGMTNNRIVNELFDNKLIYETDLSLLLQKGLDFEKKENKNELVLELMNYVKDNHTYLNRANTIIKYVNEYTDFVI
jgi:hypothetical protein